MGNLQKLRSLGLLVFLFYIACYTIPAKYQRKIWNSDIVNNQAGQSSTNLDSERKELFPDETGGEEQGELEVQNISDCSCSRQWMYPPQLESAHFRKTGSYRKRLNSSCSDEGTLYQANQNVISFSLFHPEKSSKSKYVSTLNLQIGLMQNLLMMRKHYPGYSMRIYTDVSLEPRGKFCDLLCKNEDLFWCDIKKTPSHGDLSWTNVRTWRFLTLGDPTVNVFHIRDLDSLISHREAAAAEDWLSNSDKAIIVLRDCKGNHNVPMLGGMWGADNSRLEGKGDNLRQKLISKSQLSTSKVKGLDQTYLNSEIFYPMAKDILAYDSYHCVGWSKFTEVRPFPSRQTKPSTDFVGNIIKFTENGTEPRSWTAFECPLECRPSYGLDWIYC